MGKGYGSMKPKKRKPKWLRKLKQTKWLKDVEPRV
tara:strand:+ start:380 stop:484 length:105 start_codon:yes stop_codon:yes gene_type:complete